MKALPMSSIIIAVLTIGGVMAIWIRLVNLNHGRHYSPRFWRYQLLSSILLVGAGTAGAVSGALPPTVALSEVLSCGSPLGLLVGVGIGIWGSVRETLPQQNPAA